MLYTSGVDGIAGIASKKVGLMKRTLPGFLIWAMFAGFYIGIGVMFAFICAAPMVKLGGPGLAKIVAGAGFGIALVLVINAGAELFTGYNLFTLKGVFRGTVSLADCLLSWFWTFVGNLGGSFIFALLVIGTGIMNPEPWNGFLMKIAAYKMNAPWWELFFRGIFCNWLVCLGIWCAVRATSDFGKIIMPWWCLFIFITTGMEHVVANMTILALANFMPHDPALISWGKMFGWNFPPVTLGNIVGGSFFVCFLYWFPTYLDECATKKLEAQKGVTGGA